MATCLDSLGDDHVAARIRRSTGFINRSHLPRCQSAVVMDDLHELSTWVVVEELDNPAEFCSLLDELARRLRGSTARSDDEVYAECAVGKRPRALKQAAERRRIEPSACGSQHSQRARFGNSGNKFRG